MRKRLLIYCEGATEEIFVERLLRHHLEGYGVKVERPILAATSLQLDGQRGGFVNWEAIVFDLHQIFASDASVNLRFTTLLDVFRIPDAVPGMAAITAPLSAVADVDHVERAIETTLGEPRFKAYLQRHEMETLLLTDIAALRYIFPPNDAGIQQLATDIEGFANAEDINHGATTHPAARLAAAIPGYENLKASHAYWVLRQADFTLVRKRCPRFNAWLAHWESWGTAP